MLFPLGVAHSFASKNLIPPEDGGWETNQRPEINHENPSNPSWYFLSQVPPLLNDYHCTCQSSTKSSEKNVCKVEPAWITWTYEHYYSNWTDLLMRGIELDVFGMWSETTMRRMANASSVVIPRLTFSVLSPELEFGVKNPNAAMTDITIVGMIRFTM